MWKIWYLIGLLLLLSLIIDDSFGGPVPRPTNNVSKTASMQKVTGTSTAQKVTSLNSLCHLLNYGEFFEPGIITRSLNLPNEPIRKYQTGHNGRIEYVYAVVTPQTIRGGSTTNDAVRKYARSMGKNTDDAGHIIANQLGGTGRSNYNIFPQSPNINRGAWSQEEKAIYNIVSQTNQPVEVVVQFYYPTTTSTRPKHFTYRASYNNACHSASIINP